MDQPGYLWLARLKKEGGLGIRTSREANVAMLGKHVWSLINEHHKLWIDMLDSTYLHGNSIFFWQGISHTTPLIPGNQFSKLHPFSKRVLDIGLASHVCERVDYVHFQDVQLTLRDIQGAGTWQWHKIATPLPTDVKNDICNMSDDMGIRRPPCN